MLMVFSYINMISNSSNLLPLYIQHIWVLPCNKSGYSHVIVGIDHGWSDRVTATTPSWFVVPRGCPESAAVKYSVQPANPDAVSKWPGSNMAAPTAKLTTTWSSTSSGKISIYWVSNLTKFTKWKLTFEARIFITLMSGGTFLQGRN